MLKKIMNVKINYDYNDKDKNITIILLHGWGQNIDMMKPIKDRISNDFNVLSIDLPGFGKSSEPDYSWSVYDYAECINKMVNDLKIKEVIIIGHSFGGRIGLIYASKYKIKSLICLASPYCKEISKLTLTTKFYKTIGKIKCLKWLKNIVRNKIGSVDYKNASEIMKGVLVKSINIDMVNDVKNIKCHTLLIWGSLDTAVPTIRAYELKDLIRNSKLIVYDGCTHYAYLERIDKVIIDISDFIKES